MVAQIFVVQPCSHRSGQGLSVGPRNAFRPCGPSQLGHGYFTVQDLRLMGLPQLERKPGSAHRDEHANGLAELEDDARGPD
jgi:hypothetical protein